MRFIDIYINLHVIKEGVAPPFIIYTVSCLSGFCFLILKGLSINLYDK